MIKILIWGATDVVGGVEMVLLNYISNISIEDIQFDFINTYDEISIGDSVTKRGGRIISLPNRKRNYFKYIKELNSFMKDHASEYTCVWLNDCMFGNIDILKLAKKYGIKRRIIHAHNSLNMGGGVSRLIRHKVNSYRLKNYATDYWACSMLAAQWSYTKSTIRSEKINVVPNAVDLGKFGFNTRTRNRYREELGLKGNVVFGHVGRFHYQKNHRFLIQIFSEILKIVPNAKLLLIGDGEDKESIIKLVKELNICDSVVFLGIRNDVAHLFQAMDAFLLPSLFEGLPVVMVEAQASSLPCYVADTITQESDISGNVRYYSLGETACQWAKNICMDLESFIREDVSPIVKNNGYSIKDAAEKLKAEFIQEGTN